jgi:hypothetical protein
LLGGTTNGAYDVNEVVRLYPEPTSSEVTFLSGDDVYTGTVNDAGRLAGCSDYSVVYTATMNYIGPLEDPIIPSPSFPPIATPTPSPTPTPTPSPPATPAPTVRLDTDLELSASANSLNAGEQVELTAFAEFDLGDTPYWLVIERLNGSDIQVCGAGFVCYGYDSRSTSGRHTYRAVLSASQDGASPIATSNSVSVQWASVTAPLFQELDPANYDATLSTGESYEGNPPAASATYTHAFFGGVGRLGYVFELDYLPEPGDVEVCAHLSSEHAGYSADPDFYSDVSLIVNGQDEGFNRVTPDDGAGADYCWAVGSSSFQTGENVIQFAVLRSAEYPNGVCIYDEPVRSGYNSQYIYLYQ